MAVDRKQMNELLVQSLENELGGVEVYNAAIACAVDADLKKEWNEYLEETEEHVRILREVFDAIGLDQEAESPGRQVVRHLGASLVQAMTMAQKSGAPKKAAQLVAAECVVIAESKCHMDWELIGKLAEAMDGEEGEALKAAHAQVEDQEDHHLYHTRGWARELWIDSLGMPAVLPPPEEVRNVETAIGAARAEAGRGKMLGKAS